MDSQKLYKAATRFPEVKTDSQAVTPIEKIRKDSPNLYKPVARFANVKTNSPNFYKPPTRFADVKTDSPNFYKHATRFAYLPNV